MLFLHHGTTSVCAIKVRLTLAEKALPWEGRVLDLRAGEQHHPDYLALNPNGVVPTLEHDGRVIIESTLILEYLEDAFGQPLLMPADPWQRAQARLWMKRIDDTLHAACSSITFAIAFRRVMLRLTPEALEAHLARIPDIDYRERQRESIAHGLEAPGVARSLRAYDRYLADMDAALAHTAWLAGDDYGLADIAATPYVNRAAMLGLEGLWQGCRPHLAAWFDRVRARPSFDLAITRWIAEAERDRFTVDRAQVWPTVQRLLGEVR